MSNVVVTGIKNFYLKLDHKEYIDADAYNISSYTATWGVNSIPACEISVAVGINADSGKYSNVHSRTGGLAGVLNRTPAEVYVSLEGERVPGEPWPSGGGAKRIFKGYVHSVRATRSVKGAAVAITLYHWASDLNTSHFGYGKYSPSTPWDIFKSKSVINTEGLPDWLYNDDGAVEDTAILTEDLTCLFIKSLTHSLTDTKIPVFRDGATDPNHGKAIEALGKVQSLGCKLKSSVWEGTKVFQEQVVLQEMGAIAHNSAGGTTAWTKLVAFCNLFQLIIICTVEEIFIAPGDAGSTDAAIKISNNEIDLGKGSGFEVHLPRGVVMYPTHQPIAPQGWTANEGDGLAVEVMGQYTVPPGDDAPEGPIDMIPAPRIFSQNFVVDTSGDTGTEVIQTSPDSEEPEGPTLESEDTTPDYVFPDEWCKNYYWNYVYARRQQAVDSVLRFDVTAGDIVEVDISQASVEGHGTERLPSFDGDTLIGQAAQVVHSLSVDRKSISTIILVKYLKSAAEAQLAKAQGADDNPLFEHSYGTSALHRPMQVELGDESIGGGEGCEA